MITDDCEIGYRLLNVILYHSKTACIDDVWWELMMPHELNFNYNKL